MAKQTVRDIDVQGKRVLVREDFNVPLDGASILDDTRIRAALPTLRLLLQGGARVVLASHLGRPAGKVEDKLRLRPVADRLGELLGAGVSCTRDCVGPEATAAVERLAAGQALMLENLRFHAEEEHNDPAFARQLASLADVYVNDAFGTAHRAHASTEGVAHLLPAVAGLLMERELEVLGKALSDPKHPFVAIIGGAKISDKIGVISHLLTKADALLIGGGMANTFLVAIGCDVAASLVEPDKVPQARELIRQAAQANVRLLLPSDAVVAAAFENTAERKTIPVKQTPAGWRIMDVGPQTVQQYAEVIDGAGTVVWNGPMGVYEMSNFATGTLGVAQAVANSKAFTIIGGGDVVAAVEHAGLTDRISHISTGGGATLELLEGKTLPGVAALNDK